MSTLYRPDIETPTGRVARLPVHNGFPVPWFVAWIGGVPEFRTADRAKLVQAVRERRCWVCGDNLGAYLSFVVGPMCGINRISAEPPSHRECATYAARNCPFLRNPNMRRRAGNMPAEAVDPPGLMLVHNPGVTLVWTTRAFKLVPENGGVLFSFGDPTGVEWFHRGRPATRDEVEAAVAFGLPKLIDVAALDGPKALATLEWSRQRLAALYPSAAEQIAG